LNPNLHLGSSIHELSLSARLFWFLFERLNQLIFPPKWCHIGSASICHFLVLDPHPKAMGPIYGSHPIGLFYFIGTWTLDPCLSGPKLILLVVLIQTLLILYNQKRKRKRNCPFQASEMI
jgi:hypothetical protein